MLHDILRVLWWGNINLSYEGWIVLDKEGEEEHFRQSDSVCQRLGVEGSLANLITERDPNGLEHQKPEGELWGMKVLM